MTWLTALPLLLILVAPGVMLRDLSGPTVTNPSARAALDRRVDIALRVSIIGTLYGAAAIMGLTVAALHGT